MSLGMPTLQNMATVSISSANCMSHVPVSTPCVARVVRACRISLLLLLAGWTSLAHGISASESVAPVPSVLDNELKALLSLSGPDAIKAGIARRIEQRLNQSPDKTSLLKDGALVRLLLLNRFLRAMPPSDLANLLDAPDDRRFLLGLAGDDNLLRKCFGERLSAGEEAVWPAGALPAWVLLWKNQSLQERARFGAVAAACAYALGGERKVCTPDGTINTPSAIYLWMRKSAESAQFAVDLTTLNFNELCLLAVVPRSLREMDYLRSTTPARAARWGNIAMSCWRVRYTLHNKEGVSIHSPGFYQGKAATVDTLEKMGGVCGAISKFGVAACRSRGVPATSVGQPGHCAFLWLTPDFKWVLANDISGMGASTGTGESYGGIGMISPWGGQGCWVEVVNQLRGSPTVYQAELCLDLAGFASGETRLGLLNTAARYGKAHPTVWRRLLAASPPGARAAVVRAAQSALGGYRPEVVNWVLGS